MNRVSTVTSPMIVEGLLLTGLTLQTSTLLREGLSLPKTNIVSLLTAAVTSGLQFFVSLIFSILYLRRGKRAPLRLMIFLFVLICVLVITSVWTFPIQDTLEYRIHTFGNLFVLAGAVGTTTAVVLKREMKLPDRVAPVVKRVFTSGVASVLLTPSAMRVEGHVVYLALLVATCVALAAPVFAGFVKRSLRPLYLKIVPPIFLALMITCCVFAPGYYKEIIKTPQNSVDAQIVVDIVMAIGAGILGLVAQTLLFVQALSTSTQEDESFSHGSESEKLVVPEEAEYSSTLPRGGADNDQASDKSRV